VSTIAKLDSEIKKANALKQLLVLFEGIKKKDEISSKLLFDGFYYFNQHNN
jgi:hypothetical protein